MLLFLLILAYPRYASISLWTPEVVTSLNIITAFNVTEVSSKTVFWPTGNPSNKFPCHRFFNIETVITNVHNNSKIIAPKRLKKSSKSNNWKCCVTTTIDCVVSANGTYVPQRSSVKEREWANYYWRSLLVIWLPQFPIQYLLIMLFIFFFCWYDIFDNNSHISIVRSFHGSCRHTQSWEGDSLSLFSAKRQ